MEQAMGTVHKRRTPRAAVDDIRAMLSLREATLLADVPEAKVRKDIETGEHVSTHRPFPVGSRHRCRSCAGSRSAGRR
jgi:hypothetical protein